MRQKNRPRVPSHGDGSSVSPCQIKNFTNIQNIH